MFWVTLPAGQDLVGDVGLEAQGQHLLLVELEELLGLPLEEGVGDDGLGGILEFLVVQTVHAAEIGDAALGGDPGAAEEDDLLGLIDPGFQRI